MRGLVPMVLVMALVAGCSGAAEGSPEEAGASGDASSTTIDGSAVEGLTTGELVQQVDAGATAAERELASLTGLEAALGGAAQVDQALTALSTSAVEQAGALMVQAASPGRFGARLADTDNQFGSMLAAAMITAGLGIDLVNASDNIEAGDRGSSQTSNGDSTFEMTATTGRVTQTTTVNVSAGGLDGSMAVVLDVVPCPGPDGTFSINGSIAASSQASGGGRGQRIGVEVVVSGRVDDDARIAQSESSTRIEAASTKGGDNLVDVTVRRAADGKVTVPSFSAGSGTSEKFRSDMTQLGLLLGELITSKALDAVQKSIESGRCVDLQVATSPGQTNLAPSTRVAISAKPRSKVDGSPTGGGVTGTLSGGSALDPAGTKVPADAEFTYVAPGESGQKASVSLEARSRRGVGRAQLFFDTAAGAYAVSGSFPTVPRPTTWEGVICALDQPFTLDVGGALPGVMKVTPSSAQGGSWTYAGKPFNAPFRVRGNGSYSINAPTDGAPGQMAFTFRTTIYIPKPVGPKTSSGEVALTLTPRAACQE